MWWVGGRFSLCCRVDNSLAIGFDNFDELLAGANEMDHFKTAEFKENACYFSLAKYMVQLF
jgi:glucose-6-phosphate isomerase